MENLILTTHSTEQITGIIEQSVKIAVQKAIEGLNPIQPQEILLTRKEAAEKLHISLVTLGDWTKRGLIKSHIIGGRILYKASELEQALKPVEAVKY